MLGPRALRGSKRRQRIGPIQSIKTNLAVRNPNFLWNEDEVRETRVGFRAIVDWLGPNPNFRDWKGSSGLSCRCTSTRLSSILCASTTMPSLWKHTDIVRPYKALPSVPSVQQAGAWNRVFLPISALSVNSGNAGAIRPTRKKRFAIL